MPHSRSLRQIAEFVPHAYRDWPSRYPGRRGFGYLCTYAPLEMLHAAGFTPLRLLQLSGPVSLADAHLPSFACGLARAVSERMLTGELDFLHGVLFVHTCDTMQCMADIWRMAEPRFPVVNLSLPTVFSGDKVRDYWITELRGLARTLAATLGSAVSEDALRASIACYNQQRHLLSRLDQQRSRLTAQQWWSLSTAGMLMPVEEHTALLESVLAGLEGAGETAGARPALIVVGAVLDDPAVLQLLDELGGRVVADDLCTSSRYFDTMVDEHMEPFAALAERYLKRAPCPAKHAAAQPRTQRLLRMCDDTGARGVVFVLPKFCEPHAFDYVPLTHVLDEAGVPHLLIETDISTPVGQLRTRLQAFVEMLEQQSG
jgi:bcr-type benzoyl-CoA reductase subunit C